jgi:hypothetical protein
MSHALRRLCRCNQCLRWDYVSQDCGTTDAGALNQGYFSTKLDSS